VVNLNPGTSYDFELKLTSGVTATITKSTWPDTFPIPSDRVTTLPAGTLTSMQTITQGGSAGAYRLYVAHPNGTTIDVNNSADHCIKVQASYVIIQGVTCKNARTHGIYVDNKTDVVIEGCDISGWGRKDPNAGANGVISDLGYHLDSAIYSNGTGAARIVIQGNKIHHPRYTSNSWTQKAGSAFPNTTHPQGAKAVNFKGPNNGNHVIRYNNFYSDRSHMFNDILLESDGSNTTNGNGLKQDSDIYQNVLSHCWDDAIEVERGDKNVRVWGNYFTQIFKSVSAGYVWDGPLYIWRNVTDVKLNAHKGGKGFDTLATRANAFIMPPQEAASQNNKTVTYLYHNTILNPANGGDPLAGGDSLAAGNGFQDYNSSYTRLVTRNNIFMTENFAVSGGPYAFYRVRGTTYLSSNYDLVNGLYDLASFKGPQVRTGTPIFRTGHGSGVGGKYQLATNSLGYNQGVALPNFNDGYESTAPDMGAHEYNSATMVFGTGPWVKSTPSASGTSATFNAIADAMADEDFPNTNTGTAQEIAVKYVVSHSRNSYLRFNVSGLSGKTITSAKLRLKESTVSSQGDCKFDVKRITGTWSETNVTWNTKPSVASTVYGSYTGGLLTNGQVLDISLSKTLFSGDGTYDLALIPTGMPTNDSAFFSREGAQAPQLIVEYQ
jgi:hypothetical protein